MRNASRGGVFVVSIDTELDINQRKIQDQRQITATCSQLTQMLARYRIPATWAVADPAHWPLTGMLSSTGVQHEGVQHEVAILGDETWVGPAAGRTHFARELHRRIQSARAEGLEATTLLLQNTELTDNLDLLYKLGISMVRPCIKQPSNAARVGPAQTLRFGVWQLQATVTYPNPSRWLPIGGTVSIRHALRRALAGGHDAHLAIDAAQLTRLGKRGMQSLEWLLRDVTADRRGSTVEMKTLSQVAADLSRPRQTVKSQSLLRNAKSHSPLRKAA